MKMMVILLLLALLLLHPCAVEGQYAPEQIHLTLHPDENKLVVTWTSFEPDPHASVVEWGPMPDNLLHNSTGRFLAYENDECGGNIRSVHSAVFDAPLGATVHYRVSSNGDLWSDTLVVTQKPRGYPHSLCLFGDMGVNADVSVGKGQLLRDTQDSLHSWVLHFGDTAYDMNDGCGAVGDAYLNAVQTYSTLQPVVYTCGNHESGPAKQYAEYITRLADGQWELSWASNSPSNRWFKVQMGKAVFFVIDPDAWVYPLVMNLAEPQYLWLQVGPCLVCLCDCLFSLTRSNKMQVGAAQSGSRRHTLALSCHAQAPPPLPSLFFFAWICIDICCRCVRAIARALYCHKTLDRECNSEAKALREGILHVGGVELWGLEPLLHQYGVDMVFAGRTSPAFVSAPSSLPSFHPSQWWR